VLNAVTVRLTIKGDGSHSTSSAGIRAQGLGLDPRSNLLSVSKNNLAKKNGY
jgi:hypothetical protein